MTFFHQITGLRIECGYGLNSLGAISGKQRNAIISIQTVHPIRSGVRLSILGTSHLSPATAQAAASIERGIETRHRRDQNHTCPLPSLRNKNTQSSKPSEPMRHAVHCFFTIQFISGVTGTTLTPTARAISLH